MMYADVVYFGNVITMDEANPSAEAVAVKDGLFNFVGAKADAEALCGPDTVVVDYGQNSIYPGLLEAHCHPMGAISTLDPDDSARLQNASTYEEYGQILKTFVEEHPGRDLYKASGFEQHGELPDHTLVDAACPDVPAVMMCIDGHSALFNTKGMEFFGINHQMLEKYGSDMVVVDEQGDPTGYIREAPWVAIMKMVNSDVDDLARQMKFWEQFYLSKGYTACYEAGLTLISPKGAEVYEKISTSGDYKLRTFTGCLVDETCQDIPGAIEDIEKLQQRFNNDYFKIIGVKTFADGVVEGRTAYLIDDYQDSPGYRGIARMTDPDMLFELYSAAASKGMNVHVHCIGDAATRAHLDAIQKAQEATGTTDNRFALAHLQVIQPDDVPRFGQLGVAAVVAPLWAPKNDQEYPFDVKYLGEQRAEAMYPIKSLIENGAVIGCHTDFPVSRVVDVPRCVYCAVMRRKPEQDESCVLGASEAITRYEVLCALTKNVAYMWREEDRLGTIEVGKIANMSVFDKDFLKDDLEEVAQAKVVATIVDGEIAYRP